MGLRDAYKGGRCTGDAHYRHRVTGSPDLISNRELFCPYSKQSPMNGHNATPNMTFVHGDHHHARTRRSQGRKAHRPNDPRRAPTSSLPITGTPLHWSAYRGDLGITWILLKVGVCSRDETFQNTTDNHSEAAKGSSRPIARCFVGRGTGPIRTGQSQRVVLARWEKTSLLGGIFSRGTTIAKRLAARMTTVREITPRSTM